MITQTKVQQECYKAATAAPTFITNLQGLLAESGTARHLFPDPAIIDIPERRVQGQPPSQGHRHTWEVLRYLLGTQAQGLTAATLPFSSISSCRQSYPHIPTVAGRAPGLPDLTCIPSRSLGVCISSKLRSRLLC
jgi:hypothetical protein